MLLPPIVEVPLECIRIDRAARQRSSLDDAGVQTLAADIQRHGLLNPVILTEAVLDGGSPVYDIIAGERRIAACKSIGWAYIPARLWETLSQLDRSRLEWAENAHRTDLPWPDQARAITAYHESALAEAPGWRLEDTARDLGFRAKSWIARAVMVTQAAKARPELWELSGLNQAYNALERGFGRELSNVLAEALEAAGLEPEEVTALDEEDAASAPEEPGGPILSPPEEPGDPTQASLSPPQASASPPRAQAAPARFTLHNADFATWADAYRGPPFQVLHLDPPYGVGFTNTGIFRKANALDKFYSDDASDLDAFWETLSEHWDKLVAPAAHIVYWYATARYTENLDYWARLAGRSGFRPTVEVNSIPLIWHKSNNRGMMTSPDRAPRHTYETALLITVGGQKLVRPMGTNVVSEPAQPDLHPSAKPLRVVRTWLAGLVDGGTRLLDPTCGHGSAIQAALELGAREAVGVELDPTHVARARVEIATQARELQALEVVSL